MVRMRRELAAIRGGALRWQPLAAFGSLLPLVHAHAHDFTPRVLVALAVVQTFMMPKWSLRMSGSPSTAKTLPRYDGKHPLPEGLWARWYAACHSSNWRARVCVCGVCVCVVMGFRRRSHGQGVKQMRK